MERPQPGTDEIVTTLESVLARNPDHPGACHYYLHAVEASSQPERALPCAERLPGLMPGAGHLVHMPAHIYMRLGKYHEAAERNQQAAHDRSSRTWPADTRPGSMQTGITRTISIFSGPPWRWRGAMSKP